MKTAALDTRLSETPNPRSDWHETTAPCMVSMVPLKERRRGGGTRLLSAGTRRTAIASDPPPTHLQTSMRNLAAPEGDRRFATQGNASGCPPRRSTLTPEGIGMQSILDLGADVDSRFVVMACAAGSVRPQRIANARRAVLEWLRTVPRGSRLGMESTGGYHELLAELAHKAGLEVLVINARDLRRYAEGIGRRGKTDRVDAEVIARYV